MMSCKINISCFKSVHSVHDTVNHISCPGIVFLELYSSMVSIGYLTHILGWRDASRANPDSYSCQTEIIVANDDLRMYVNMIYYIKRLDSNSSPLPKRCCNYPLNSLTLTPIPALPSQQPVPAVARICPTILCNCDVPS